MKTKIKLCEGCGSMQVVGEKCGICSYPKVGIPLENPASTPMCEVVRSDIPVLDVSNPKE